IAAKCGSAVSPTCSAPKESNLECLRRRQDTAAKYILNKYYDVRHTAVACGHANMRVQFQCSKESTCQRRPNRASCSPTDSGPMAHVSARSFPLFRQTVTKGLLPKTASILSKVTLQP